MVELNGTEQNLYQNLYEEVMEAEKTNIVVVPKTWGFEKIIYNQQYCGKLLYIVKGKQTSLHYHNVKDETFYVSSGRVLVYYTSDTMKVKNLVDTDRSDEIFGLVSKITLTRGDSFHMPPKTVHQIIGLEDTELFEFSTKHNDSDSIRLIKGE